jgi:hypothetical protein
MAGVFPFCLLFFVVIGVFLSCLLSTTVSICCALVLAFAVIV